MLFISAGHYPAKPGAKFDRFIEHDEACCWADILVDDINKLGNDESPAVKAIAVPVGFLKSKIDFINERVMDGDIALEVHFNAARDKNNNPIGRGCETLYYPGSEAGEHIAKLCQQALKQCFPPDRGAKEGWYRMNPKYGPDFFLAKTKCPAVIIEPEFVHRSDIILKNREQAIALLIDNLKEYGNE